MAHDVFISYATEDQIIANAVLAGLEKEGIRCWIATRDILPSDNYDDSIVDAIYAARIMVVIFSAKILQSAYVKSEVQQGFSKDLIIVPFRIEAVDPEGGLKLHLGRKHWLDAMTPPMEAHIRKLATTVRSILDAPKDRPAAQPSEALPPAQSGAPQAAASQSPGASQSTATQTDASPKKTQTRLLIGGVAGGVAILAFLCVAVLGFLAVRNIPGLLNGSKTKTPTVALSDSSTQIVPNGAEPFTAVPQSPANTAAPVMPVTAATSTLAAGEPAANTSKWMALESLPRNVNAFLIDPADSKVVYAACGDYTGAGAGMYKSMDAGLTWTKSADGLPNRTIKTVGMTPGDKPVLLAGIDSSTDIYASGDGAKTWKQLSSAGTTPGATVKALLAGKSAGRLFALVDRQGIMASDNTGQTWTPVGDGLPKDKDWGALLQSLSVDPGNPKVLYAGIGGIVGQGGGVYKSMDSGETFVPSNKGMIDAYITSIAVDPRDSKTIYTGSSNSDLFKSTDAGQTWTNLKDRITVQFNGMIVAIQIDPGSGGIYLLENSNGVYFSPDGGNTWRLQGTPPNTNQPQFSTLSVIFGDKPVIFAATTGVNSARAWRFGEGEAASAAPTPVLGESGPEKKISLSGTWQSLADLPHQVNTIVIDPNDPKMLVAGTGRTGTGGGVFRSEDGGLTWMPSASGLTNDEILALCFSNGANPTLIASGGVRGNIYGSHDKGKSWASLATQVFFGSFGNSLYASPVEANTLYLIVNPGGLLRTTNGGQSWTPMGDGLPKSDQQPLALALAIDPTNPKVIYAGTGGFVGQGQGVFKSTDGGDTFSSSNQGMLDFRITAMAVDPKQSNIVYAGSDSGDLFKSSDGGQTWTNLKDRLALQQYGEPRQIRDIRIDPTSGIIYVLGDNSGLLYSGNGGEKWRLVGNPPGTNQPQFSAMAIQFGDSPTIFLAVGNEGGVWRFGEK